MYPWNMADHIYPWVHPGTELTSIVEGSSVLDADGAPIPPSFQQVTGVVTFAGEGCVAFGEEPLLALTGKLTPDLNGTMVRLVITAEEPSVVRILSDRPDGSTWAVSNLAEISYPMPRGTSPLVAPVAPVEANAVTVRAEEGAVCVVAADLVRPDSPYPSRSPSVQG